MLSQNSKLHKEFSAVRSQQCADGVAEFLNGFDGLALEKVYALAAVMRSIGEVLYDQEDTSYDSVLQDYSKAPTWPAALILISHLPHEIRELLIRERDNPEINEKIWKEHEEKLNGRD